MAGIIKAPVFSQLLEFFVCRTVDQYSCVGVLESCFPTHSEPLDLAALFSEKLKDSTRAIG